MCEIFLIYFACKSLGDMLRAKRRDPVLLQIALVVCWIGGEVTGAAVGFIAAGGRALGGQQEAGAAILVGAVCGAAAGATFVFVIAANLRARLSPRGSRSNVQIRFPGEVAEPAPSTPPVAMPARIRFQCPNGHILEEVATAAGQPRRCPHCQSTFVVPNLS